MVNFVRFLYVVSALTQAVALLLLVRSARVAQRALAEPARHTTDGGNAAGETGGPNAGTVADQVLRGMTLRLWLPVLLLSGIMAGLVGNFLALELG